MNKTDNVQKSDNSDVINKMEKDEKTVDLKDKTEHTDKTEVKETPERIKETVTPDKKEEKADKIEKVEKIETPVKVKVMEKDDQFEKPVTKDVSVKDEKPAEKKETMEKTESSLKMNNEKVDQVEKPEVKTEKVKADENKSNQDTAEDNKPDLKLENDKVEKEQKTGEVKVEKTEKVESADKKSAKAEKDEKGEKAKKPAAKPTAAKPAVNNGAPAKDLSSPEKKTKVCEKILLFNLISVFLLLNSAFISQLCDLLSFVLWFYSFICHLACRRGNQTQLSQTPAKLRLHRYTCSQASDPYLIHQCSRPPQQKSPPAQSTHSISWHQTTGHSIHPTQHDYNLHHRLRYSG